MERLSFILVIVAAFALGHNSGYAQCRGIDFTAADSTGCTPEVITLQATGVDSSYDTDWVIRKDTFEDRHQLQKLFFKPGQFDVELLVTKGGQQCSIKKAAYITIGDAPQKLDMNLSRNQLCDGPGKVSFESIAKNFSTYDWVIENQEYENAGPKINHEFKTTGKKSVTLSVEDTLGCQAVQNFDSVLYIGEPITPLFKADSNAGLPGLTTSFEAEFNAGKRKLDFAWSFQNGSPNSSTQKQPSGIQFSQTGQHNVELTVTDSEGCAYEMVSDDHIQISDKANLDFEVNKTEICPGEAVQLTNKSKAKGGAYYWKTGEQSYQSLNGQKTLDIQIAEPGINNITLLYEKFGVRQKLRKDSVINVKPLKADFTVSPVCHCQVPAKVSLFNESIVPNSGNVSYEWKVFNEKGRLIQRSRQESPKFKIKQFGNYDVQLTVSHENGCSDKAYHSDFIRLQPFDNEIDLEFETTAVNTPMQLKFPEDSFCSKDSLHVLWSIYSNGGSKLIKYTNDRNPVVNFPDSGDYEIDLKVSNNKGCTSYSSSRNDEEALSVVTPGTGTSQNPDTNQSISRFYCPGEPFQLIENTVPKVLNYTHKWALVKGKDTVWRGTGDTVTPSLAKPGLYDVQYQAFVDSTHSFTDYQKDEIGISGVRADMALTDVQHCLPYEATLKSRILENHHFSNDSDSLAFEWLAKPEKGIEFSNPNDSMTGVRVSKAGHYDIHLKVTNSNGCTETIKKKGFVKAGVKANFDLPDVVCAGNRPTVKNHSFPGESSVDYQWTSSKGKVDFAPSKQAKSPEVNFRYTGQHQIMLMVENDKGCRDTFSKTVNNQKVLTDFRTLDTVNHCAPSPVRFNVTQSVNVDQFQWEYGDGVRQNKGNEKTTHVYRQNSGDQSTGFDVTLVAKSQAGCRDKVVKKDYVKVIGPVPEFKIDEKEGCEPLKVEFEKQGSNYIQSFMDYGDRSNVDSAANFEHIYNYKSENSTYSEFKPVMVAKDSFGCYAIEKADTAVTVHQKPKANFAINKQAGCEPFKVEIADSTGIQTTNQWTLGNQQAGLSKADVFRDTLRKGVYDVKMAAETAAGCKDTVAKEAGIEVFEKPEADFSVSKNEVCLNATIEFTDQSRSETEEIREWQWELGVDSSEESQPTNIVYPKVGSYDVALEVVNGRNCRDRIQKQDFIRVLDTIATKPEIAFASVGQKGNSLKVNWQKNEFSGFQAYELSAHWPSSGSITYRIAERADTTFSISLNEEQGMPSVTLQVIDQCDFTSPKSRLHRAPILQVNSDSLFTNQLDWSPVQGWDQVGQYEVYKRSKGQEWGKIGESSPSATHFIDSGLCDQEYAYQVVAVKANSNIESASTIGHSRPQFRTAAITDLVEKVSIEEGKTHLHWDQPDHFAPDHYLVESKNGAGFWETIHSTQKLKWIGESNNTGDGPHSYRIKAVDHCDNQSNGSNVSSPIYLRSKTTEDHVKLNWSHYKGWAGGVKHYEVQLKQSNGKFETIEQLNNDEQSYIDEKGYSEKDTAYRYRIEAVGYNDRQSHSNESASIMPSKVYVPNAFTPNGDGLNDEFGITAVSIGNYSESDIRNFRMVVYNQWGQKVFESNDYTQGWKGMHRGQKVSSGNYFYTIQATGADGDSYFLNGSVKVLR